MRPLSRNDEMRETNESSLPAPVKESNLYLFKMNLWRNEWIKINLKLPPKKSSCEKKFIENRNFYSFDKFMSVRYFSSCVVEDWSLLEQQFFAPLSLLLMIRKTKKLFSLAFKQYQQQFWLKNILYYGNPNCKSRGRRLLVKVERHNELSFGS